MLLANDQYLMSTMTKFFPMLGEANLYFSVNNCLLRDSRKIWLKKCNMIKNSCPEVFYTKGVVKNFEKLTGKHLCPSIIFSKVAVLRPGIKILFY